MSTAKVTRRRLLQQGATALGAAAMFPYVVPASAAGRDGKTPPSERVNMGHIGIGGQGGGHLLGGAWTYITGGYVARDDVQVLAVCDVSKGRREGACQRVNDHYAGKMGAGNYNACKAYVDFRDVLARDDIDAVLIATPIHWHSVMSVMAAKAGKDIYCEKPTALTIRESQAVVDAVLRYGRVYQGGTQQRSEYGGKFRIACECVRSGRIGKLKEVWAYCRGGTWSWQLGRGAQQPIPADLDWDLWLGPAPMMPFDGNWGGHRFASNGINWGQHHFDIMQWGIGADRTGPISVAPVGPFMGMGYANDVTVYTCGYPGADAGTDPAVWTKRVVAGDMEHPFYGPEGIGLSGGVRFIGSDGWIAVDRDTLVAQPAHILKDPPGPKDVRLYHADSHSGNFLECVRSRRRTIVDVETAHRSASALLLAGLGDTLQRELHWDPEKQCFPGDDEANRLLSTSFRSPWQV